MLFFSPSSSLCPSNEVHGSFIASCRMKNFIALASCIWTTFQNPLYLVRLFFFILFFILSPTVILCIIIQPECISRTLSHFLFFSCVSTRNRFRVLFYYFFLLLTFTFAIMYSVLIYSISRVCWFFPKVIQSNFWIYSLRFIREPHRCWWWCQIYVFCGNRESLLLHHSILLLHLSPSSRSPAFMKNKNCETEIKLNSKQQFTSFNGCSFFYVAFSLASSVFVRGKRLKES